MKKISTLLILFHVISVMGFAQVDDLREESEKDKDNNKEYHSTPNESYNSDSPVVDGCIEGCFAVLFSECTAIMVGAMATWHENLLENRDEDPTIVSLDILPHAAYNIDPKYNSYIFSPRVRGTWGLFSTDFRFNLLIEYEENLGKTFKTFDWQILELNLLSFNAFNLRLGSGWLYNYHSQNSYNEHFLGMELRLHDQFFLATMEGRSAWDYEGGGNVFHEATLRTSYRFVNYNRLYGYLTGGIVYQNHFMKIDYITLQAGFSFNIH